MPLPLNLVSFPDKFTGGQFAAADANELKTRLNAVVTYLNGAPATPTNQIPTANAGADTSIQLPIAQAQLSGSGTDVDGTIKAFQWEQTSGPNLATWNSKAVANPMVSGLIAGTYTFTLITTDDKDATSVSDSVTVTVLPEPQVGSTVTLDFSTSSANMLYNVLDEQANGYRKRSGFAQTKPITTDHTSVDVYIQTQGVQNYVSNIHIFKNGSPFAIADPPNGLGTEGNEIETVEKVTVALGSGSKVLSFREGPAQFLAGVYRNFPITKLVFSGGTGLSIGEPALAQNVLILLGTSILSSVSPTDMALGMVPRLRIMPAFADWRIASTTASGGYCVARFGTPAAVSKLVDQMEAYVGNATGEVVIYDEDITNNAGFGAGVEEFKRVKAAIWDEIRRRKPAWRIVAQNATHRNDENAISLADYDYDYGNPHYAGITPAPAFALKQIVDVRSNYVRKTADAHGVIGSGNYNDNVHPNLTQGDANLAAFIANEVLNTPPTVGTAVYVPPVIQDEVLYDFDFSQDLLDHGPNAFAMTNTGVTLDATKGAAYFNGSATLSRPLSAKDAYPRGFKHEFEFQFEGSNDAYFGLGQGPGDFRVSIQNTSGGKAKVSVTANDINNNLVGLTSQEVNVVAGFIAGVLTWNRSTLKLQVAGGTSVSIPLDSLKSIAGYQATIGSAQNSGANWKGWVKRWKMTATGSGEVITVLPELSALTPNTGAKESLSTATGANFGSTQGAGSLTFGGIAAEVTAWSATQITFKVPIAAPVGANTVRVTTNAGQSNALTYTVTQASGVVSKYDLTQSATSDISGNGLNFSIEVPPGGGTADPAVTPAGTVFSDRFLSRDRNFRDTFETGWSAKMRIVSQDTPLDAYSTYLELTSSIALIGQSSGSQMIFKLVQYTDAQDNYALIIMDAVPVYQTTHELLMGWNASVLSLSIDGVVKTVACNGFKTPPAGQGAIVLGKTARAATIVSLETSN